MCAADRCKEQMGTAWMARVFAARFLRVRSAELSLGAVT